MSALDGIRVIEIASEKIAMAGKLLGDMGADVILIEPTSGDPSRSFPPFVDDEPGDNRSLHFMHYNTSKRSVVLDLDSTNGQSVFCNLIKTADVLIESEPITRLADLSLDYADLVKIQPNLIHVAVTPYGRNEPSSDLPATDLTLMAAGGPPWSCGYDDHSLPPVRGWGNQGFQTGCHYAFMSILTALLHRNISGIGQFIDVSITAALNVTTEAASYSWLVNQSTVQRQTGRHAQIVMTAESQVLCADGRYVNTGVPPRFPAEFQKLITWMTETGLAEDFPEAVFLEMGAAWDGPFDLSRIGEDETITAIFMAGREALLLIAASVSAYEFFTGCQRAGLSVGVIYSPEEAFEDEHFKERGFPVEVDHDDLGRTLTYPGAPYNLPLNPWSISRRAPHLGEHTEEIMASLRDLS
ncbi:MAG: CoA transferase [Pseudomonadales bacterium]|jgi:crotonobetainyl-CoA:carnitine CoA-transferase CaiB-like acyl-CoA transferase|nr:carnitine dehydratase [Gammaproteobacteria bacterium]MDP6024269.1 CoA transferase [Pseudomonadales bacterium]MDP7452038.1 CoA transferase [Arenicellales bacterium]MDP7315711.1 CoA transferase [Pseudomonadales bacterium]MDP7575457.1 CoA transferase [Pseudomonadales bacterium]|tara:strand:+ start:14990 stop:16225 length:1236 start_codon:yes stop_codon:yes gene_type:complete